MIAVIGAFPESELTLIVLDEENEAKYRAHFWYPAFFSHIDAMLAQFEDKLNEIMIWGPSSYIEKIAMQLVNHGIPENIQISLMPAGEKDV